MSIRHDVVGPVLTSARRLKIFMSSWKNWNSWALRSHAEHQKMQQSQKNNSCLPPELAEIVPWSHALYLQQVLCLSNMSSTLLTYSLLPRTYVSEIAKRFIALNISPWTLQFGIYREKCVDTNQSKSMKDRLWEVFKFWWIRLRNWELTRKN